MHVFYPIANVRYGVHVVGCVVCGGFRGGESVSVGRQGNIPKCSNWVALTTEDNVVGWVVDGAFMFVVGDSVSGVAESAGAEE